MALARYILGKFLGVGCHCFPPPLDVPTFSTRCLHVQRHKRPLAAEGGTLRGQEMFWQISSRIRLPCNSRNLLHAANLRHETDGFTSPPNEGMLRIFSPLKIRRLRPGLNPRTWVPKASTLTPRPPKPLEWHIVIRISWHFSKCCSCHFQGGWIWGLCVVPLCSFDSRQCAGRGLTGIIPHNAQCHKMASAAIPQTPRHLYWTMWPNPKRQSSAMNNGHKNLNIRNTENHHWKCREGLDKAT